jgi:tripartite ATP-independent transporter DctM subunit
MVSLKNVWPTVILFLLVIGGIYSGIFTATEAGAVGAFGAIVITFAMRRLNGKNFRDAVLETATTSALVLFLLVGDFIFMKFLAVSKLPFMLANLITGFEVNRYITFAVIIIIYIILGMFLDIYSAITLTIPIIYPVIIALNFDPIWYGVIMVLVMEMGLITPPVGLNVFALGGVTDVPMGTIFKGVWWFVGSILLLVVILTVFPVVATFIPDMM